MSLIGIARMNTILMAVTVFLYMKRNTIVIKSVRIQRIVRELGSLSFGVYLVHILMIDTLNRGYIGVTITPYIIHPLIGIPIQAIAAFILSIAAVYTMRKVPFIRAIVP
jgi:peptidoglycan/LPS O-acetylase OafA/YrhL